MPLMQSVMRSAVSCTSSAWLVYPARVSVPDWLQQRVCKGQSARGGSRRITLQQPLAPSPVLQAIKLRGAPSLVQLALCEAWVGRSRHVMPAVLIECSLSSFVSSAVLVCPLQQWERQISLARHDLARR